MRAALRRRYSGIVGADPGKRPSVLLEHAGAWAYSLRSPSAVEGLLVLFPARANSPHRNFVRAYFFFILIESNTIIPFERMALWHVHVLVLVICFLDRKSTRLNSSHTVISYAVFCLKKKNKK